MSKVDVSKKKDFIRWFMNSFRLKNNEVQWLLSFMLANDVLIENCHFINNVDKIKDRTIIASTICSEDVPFLYKKTGKVIYDVSEAFHDIRTNPNKNIYIYLSFAGKMAYEKYINVLEENGNTIGINSVISEILTDKLLHKQRMDQLYKEIDKALDEGDRDKFMVLSKEWNELRELYIK